MGTPKFYDKEAGFNHIEIVLDFGIYILLALPTKSIFYKRVRCGNTYISR